MKQNYYHQSLIEINACELLDHKKIKEDLDKDIPVIEKSIKSLQQS